MQCSQIREHDVNTEQNIEYIMGADYLELFYGAVSNLRATSRNESIAICDESGGAISIDGIRFNCEVKKAISNANIFAVIDRMKDESRESNMPMILITENIYPKLANTLADSQINWIDKAGNCDIRHKNLTITIAGQKGAMPTQRKTVAKTSEANIKLILFFLQNPESINWTYREIQEKTQLSLGTITKTFDLLKAKHYLVQTENGRKISMREELIEWWQQQYNEFLKPKLLINRMSFRNPEQRKNWKNLPLPEGMCWGGDCGANLMDGYLIPGDYEIYSDVVSSLLLRTGAVTPTPDGEIRIYKKFWIGKSEQNHAPALVVYADLMGTGDSRCHEAALKIKANGI